jgi:hypothetical protein
MRTSLWVLAAFVAGGMSSAGCAPANDDDNVIYGAGMPVGVAPPSGGAGGMLGSGGSPADASGGTGAAGMDVQPGGTGGAGATGTGGVPGVPIGGSGGMAANTGAGGAAPAGSGGAAAAGSGGAPAASGPCPDVNIADFGIMLPACCTPDNQCGIDGSTFGGAGCTPLSEAQSMAAAMGAPAGTIPDPRPCPAM